MAIYRVAPFSGGDGGRAAWNRNLARGVHDPDAQPCAICGKHVKPHATKPFIWRGVNVDGTWAAEGENGTQGAFVVGFDCDRKYRA